MSLTAPGQFNAETLIVNPVFSGLLEGINPSDFALAHADMFPKITYASKGNSVGYYYRYSFADNLRKIDDKELIRRPGSPAKSFSRGRYLETFRVNRRHADAIVAEDEAKQIADMTGGADNPHVSELSWLRELLLLQKETRAADLLQNDASVGHAANAAAYWDDYAASDPVEEINEAILQVRAQCGLKANTLALPYVVARRMALHPKLKALRAYTERNGVNVDAVKNLLKDIFSIEDVVIFEAMANTSRPSESPVLSLDEVWGPSAYVYHRSKQTKVTEMIWTAEGVDTYFNGGFETGVYPIQDLDAETTKYRVKEDSEFLVFNKELAVALRNVVASLK